jgi:hypothetical protein
MSKLWLHFSQQIGFGQLNLIPLAMDKCTNLSKACLGFPRSSAGAIEHLLFRPGSP